MLTKPCVGSGGQEEPDLGREGLVSKRVFVYLNRGPPPHYKEGWRACKKTKRKSPPGCRLMGGGKEE